jgi:hypothetical protein
MAALPTPRAHGLPSAAVIAVPVDGLAVFRLVRSDPPTEGDFTGQSPSRARLSGLPELLRLGVSHFLTAEGAERVRRDERSSLARVVLRPDRGIHAARTGSRDHVTVWAPAGELLEAAKVVG